MSSLVRAKTDRGFTSILGGEIGTAGIRFGILRLEEGCAGGRDLDLASPVFEEDSGLSEVALVILGGKCIVETAGKRWGPVGERDSVFAGRATAVYVPPRTRYRVSPVGAVEIAICGAPCGARCGRSRDAEGAEGAESADSRDSVDDAAGREPQIVTPDLVVANVRGTGNFRREVHDIIASNVNAHRLVVGETFTPAGNWSSYPPHKHDIDDLPHEVKMEEVYFFKVRPGHGFGVQVIYQGSPEPREEAYVVRDGDAVFIESGYHPVVTAPGYDLYYLWVMAATGARPVRTLVPRTDPAHAWVEAGAP